MQDKPTEPVAPQVPAKRGDLVVVHVHHTDHDGYDFFHVGVVTNITRDGHVKKWREARSSVAIDLTAYVGFQASYVMPKAEVDVEAAVKTAAANPWPHGNPGMPYGSLDEVRAAVRPHLIKVAGS